MYLVSLVLDAFKTAAFAKKISLLDTPHATLVCSTNFMVLRCSLDKMEHQGQKNRKR